MYKAWHLRQDGEAFPVKVHIYCMEDDDLSSEAEAAAFIISTDSKDQDLAEYVLDAWMALLIENEVSYTAESSDIDEAIREAINHIPYHFQYSLSDDDLLSIHNRQGNYNNVDTLYEFVDSVRSSLSTIQSRIKKSLNQQFCRVRYGGQYNSVAGNNEIWCRVSSVNYNWANTIYIFIASMKNKYRINQVTICRDSESDGGFANKQEYFYKAKDGTLYKHMPIDEYLEEEHEHSPVFESLNLNEGILCTIRKSLMIGNTYHETAKMLEHAGLKYERDPWKYFARIERNEYCVPSNI